jgi:hypothetical protein
MNHGNVYETIELNYALKGLFRSSFIVFYLKWHSRKQRYETLAETHTIAWPLPLAFSFSCRSRLETTTSLTLLRLNDRLIPESKSENSPQF